jgi:hypothetical protein
VIRSSLTFRLRLTEKQFPGTVLWRFVDGMAVSSVPDGRSMLLQHQGEAKITLVVSQAVLNL